VHGAVQVYGDDDPHVATALRCLASVLHGQGKFAEAEQCYRGALEIRRKVRDMRRWRGGNETASCHTLLMVPRAC